MTTQKTFRVSFKNITEGWIVIHAKSKAEAGRKAQELHKSSPIFKPSEAKVYASTAETTDLPEGYHIGNISQQYYSNPDPLVYVPFSDTQIL